MSFPRAPIKRFNEPADSIPPPNIYEPKYPTDLSNVISTVIKNAPVLRKTSTSCIKSRSEDAELCEKPAGTQLRRDGTFTRSTVSTVNTSDSGKREPAVTYKQLYENSKSRVHRQNSFSNSHDAHNINRGIDQSPNSEVSGKMSYPEVKLTKVESNPNLYQNFSEERKSLTKLGIKHETDRAMGQGDQGFQEIQNLTRSLQVEVNLYKSKLSSEVNKTKDLEAKNNELEFVIQSLLCELESLELEKKKALQEKTRAEVNTQTSRENTSVNTIDHEQTLNSNEPQAKLIFLENSTEAVLVASFEVTGTVIPYKD